MQRTPFRLSFSRAEVTLLNSWTRVQQIVYHMLRVFVKTERLTDNATNSDVAILSNYHIKTLMLWACEKKSRIWWTDDYSLVRVCVELLHDLAVWLTEARCPHYFINNCNLIVSCHSLEMIGSQLMSVSKSWLSSWFVNNYIRKCSQLCPHNVSRLFDDVSTITRLQNAVSAIVDWRLSTLLCEMLKVHSIAVKCITHVVSRNSQTVSSDTLTVKSLACLLTILRKMTESISLYFMSVVFLHVACRTSRSGLTDEWMDFLAVAVGQSVSVRRYSSPRSSVLLLSKAVSLMKAVDRSKSRGAVQLIAIELSKAYLCRALSCEDSDSDSIYCLANTYLAVLYYSTGQYQMAVDRCTLVRRSQDHSQCSSHVIQGERLPKTDDDIDIALGLAVFYQHVRMAALNQQHRQYVTVFTTELFAHYLHIKCLSVTKCQQLNDATICQSSVHKVQCYAKYIANIQQLLIADALVWRLVNTFSENKCVYKQHSSRNHSRSKFSTEENTSDLVELLQKSAIEHLTTFRHIEARDFGSVATIITTDFVALYAYKHGDYQRCLQLSTQSVHTLLYANLISHVPTFPEFIQLMDDDIVSLTALAIIINPKCRDDEFSITQLTLSLYLMTQCQLKLLHSVTSLSQTLDYIIVGHRRHHPVERTIDRLILKMMAHKALTYITTPHNRS